MTPIGVQDRPGSTTSTALAVEGLTVRYGGFLALDDLSFEVADGSILAIIGPNGAGKTTCFNAICGFIRPVAGHINVHGRGLPPGDPHAAWAAGVARTFQRPGLFWTLSVRDHVELAHRFASRRRAKPPPVDEVLDLLQLTPQSEQVVASLPLGTCRLVELARALATGADILLLDEPSSGLDRHETGRFEETVRSVHRERGLTVVLIEHDIEFVASLADEIVVLDFGRWIAAGTPSDIVSSPKVREVYLGAHAVRAGEIGS